MTNLRLQRLCENVFPNKLHKNPYRENDFGEGDDSWRESEQFDKLLLNNLIHLKYFINNG